MASHRDVKIPKTEQQIYRCHKLYLHAISHFLVLYSFFVFFVLLQLLPLLQLQFYSTVQLGLSLWPQELGKPPWSWRLHSSGFFIHQRVERLFNSFQNWWEGLQRHLPRTIFFMQSFCSSQRYSTRGKSFNVLFITDLNTTSLVERSLTVTISYFSFVLVMLEYWRKTCQIWLIRGYVDPGIQEQPFLKFAHGCSFTFSCRPFFWFFRTLRNWTPGRVLSCDGFWDQLRAAFVEINNTQTFWKTVSHLVGFEKYLNSSLSLWQVPVVVSCMWLCGCLSLTCTFMTT